MVKAYVVNHIPLFCVDEIIHLWCWFRRSLLLKEVGPLFLIMSPDQQKCIRNIERKMYLEKDNLKLALSMVIICSRAFAGIIFAILGSLKGQLCHSLQHSQWPKDYFIYSLFSKWISLIFFIELSERFQIAYPNPIPTLQRNTITTT